MTCTDKNLEHLKSLLPLMDTYGHWQALFNRLEKAEKIVDLARVKRECGDILGDTDPLYDAHEEWLASKGVSSTLDADAGEGK